MLLLFIAITSSPFNSLLRISNRKTFLTLCNEENHCLYRFFIDEKYPSKDLLKESLQFNDLIFYRNSSFSSSTSLIMEKYPSNLHYGIRNPLIFLQRNETFLRLYKIESKISYIKWFYNNNNHNRENSNENQHSDHNHNKNKNNNNNKSIHYFLFIEDDSFICIYNLLYQLNQLRNHFFDISISNSTKTINTKQTIQTFRTGSYNCYKGCSFDDSSTLMTSDIATLFNSFYPSNLLHCNNILSRNLSRNEIISWGRSWRKEQCNWNELFKKNFNLEINYPDTSCYNYFSSSILGDLLCPISLPLIYHTHGRKEIKNELKKRNLYNKQTCEYFLLLDKVRFSFLSFFFSFYLSNNNNKLGKESSRYLRNVEFNEFSNPSQFFFNLSIQ